SFEERRPILSQHIGAHSHSNVDPCALERPCGRSLFFRQIRIGETLGCQKPEEPGDVRRFASRVGWSQKDSANSMLRALRECRVFKGKVPRVLAKKGGEYECPKKLARRRPGQ